MKSTAKINTRIAVGLMIFTFAMVWAKPSMASGVNSIDILDYGLYKTEFAAWKAAPNTVQGQIQLVSDKKLVELTERIPGDADTEFGIRYVVNGDEEQGLVDLLVRVVHEQTGSSQEWVIAKQIGAPCFDGWRLQSGSQIMPGTMTIQLFHGQTKLAEKSFEVYEL